MSGAIEFVGRHELRPHPATLGAVLVCSECGKRERHEVHRSPAARVMPRSGAGSMAWFPPGTGDWSHALTRPQINALAEAAGQWQPRRRTGTMTWRVLVDRGYVTTIYADRQLTPRGRKWLRAAGLLA